MSTTWFTADTHFNHTKILEYDNLPFPNVHEMNKFIIKRWNEKVAPGDTVWHLGDVGFGDCERHLLKMNGTKHLIRGNHDRGRTAYWSRLFETIHKKDFMWVGEGLVLYLNHRKQIPWPGQYNGVLHLYGHSHGNSPYTEGAMDIGSKLTDHYPLSVDDIKEMFDMGRTQ